MRGSILVGVGVSVSWENGSPAKVGQWVERVERREDRRDADDGRCIHLRLDVDLPSRRSWSSITESIEISATSSKPLRLIVRPRNPSESRSVGTPGVFEGAKQNAAGEFMEWRASKKCQR